MKTADPELILPELKYCERCGGLWLRTQGTALPYCAPCARELADLPPPERRVRRPRIPGNHYSDNGLRQANRLKLVVEGGQA
jgi:hypothetical protein